MKTRIISRETRADSTRLTDTEILIATQIL